MFLSDTGIFSGWVELMYKLNITTNFTIISFGSGKESDSLEAGGPASVLDTGLNSVCT